MTDIDFNTEIGQKHTQAIESLQEIARILKRIKELEKLTDHLETLNDAEELRCHMLTYHVQLTDELSGVVFRGLAKCM